MNNSIISQKNKNKHFFGQEKLVRLIEEVSPPLWLKLLQKYKTCANIKTDGASPKSIRMDACSIIEIGLAKKDPFGGSFFIFDLYVSAALFYS